MLDSGASCASLYSLDSQQLEVIKKHYSAQSYAKFTLSNGAKMKQRVFELYVEVYGNQGYKIVDPISPIVPNQCAVGGSFPVLEIKDKMEDTYYEGSYAVSN